ncbi:hypothetical protein A9Q84_02585 [Halobacteriovorax marinus]|uniref:Uncharacterized protein n=1 Tax=Halobacteriovorax marinus TaxID=97084 RepID=A0A1Y5FIB7_9BACT|nr:hypothetical protein A9Q84_02585 [Halobacteriovorax marinus]
MKNVTKLIVVLLFMNSATLALFEDTRGSKNSKRAQLNKYRIDSKTYSEDEVKKNAEINFQLAQAVCQGKRDPVVSNTLNELMEVGLYNYCDQYEDQEKFCSCVSEVTYEQKVSDVEIKEFEKNLIKESRKNIMLESVQALALYKYETLHAGLSNANKGKKDYPNSAPSCKHNDEFMNSIKSDCSEEDLEEMSDILSDYTASCKDCSKEFSLDVVTNDIGRGMNKSKRFLSFAGQIMANRVSDLHDSLDFFKSKELLKIKGKKDSYSYNTTNELYERELKERIAEKIFAKWQGHLEPTYRYFNGDVEKRKDVAFIDIIENSKIFKGVKDGPKSKMVLSELSLSSAVREQVDFFEGKLEISKVFVKKKISKAQILKSLDKVFNDYTNEKLSTTCENAIKVFKKSCREMKDNSKISFDFNDNAAKFRDKFYSKKDKFKFDQLYCVANDLGTQKMAKTSRRKKSKSMARARNHFRPRMNIDIAGTGNIYHGDSLSYTLTKADFSTGNTNLMHASLANGENNFEIKPLMELATSSLSLKHSDTENTDDNNETDTNYNSYFKAGGNGYEGTDYGINADYTTSFTADWSKLSLGGYPSSSFPKTESYSWESSKIKMNPDSNVVDRFKNDLANNPSEFEGTLVNNEELNENLNKSVKADIQNSTAEAMKNIEVDLNNSLNEGNIAESANLDSEATDSVASSSAENTSANNELLNSDKEFKQNDSAQLNQQDFMADGMNSQSNYAGNSNFNSNSNSQNSRFKAQGDFKNKATDQYANDSQVDGKSNSNSASNFRSLSSVDTDSNTTTSKLETSRSALEVEKLKLELEKMKLDLAKSQSELKKVSIESEEEVPVEVVKAKAPIKRTPIASARKSSSKGFSSKSQNDSPRKSGTSVSRGSSSSAPSTVSSTSNNSSFSNPTSSSSASSSSSRRSKDSQAQSSSASSAGGSSALLTATKAGDAQIFSSASRLEGNSFNSYAELQSADQDHLEKMYEKFGSEVVVADNEGQKLFELEKDSDTGEIKIIKKIAKRAPAALEKPLEAQKSRKRFTLEEFNQILDAQ